MGNCALIVIDPLIGFCEVSGSIARKYGATELSEIRRRIPKIRKAVEESKRAHLVISEYSVAKFTDGNINDELANLCVPGANEDCKVIKELSDIEFGSTSIKRDKSALSSQEFLEAINEDIDSGIEIFIIAGFLLEHCVVISAKELRDYIPSGNINVVVCSDLVGSRAEKYRTEEVTKTLDSLNKAGVEIDLWENIAVTNCFS